VSSEALDNPFMVIFRYMVSLAKDYTFDK